MVTYWYTLPGSIDVVAVCLSFEFLAFLARSISPILTIAPVNRLMQDGGFQQLNNRVRRFACVLFLEPFADGFGEKDRVRMG